MPARYVRPYSKGQKNNFRDAEAIAEAVQRPTMKFVATKTADQLDLQALHRVRERLVSQCTGIINQIRRRRLARRCGCPKFGLPVLGRSYDVNATRKCVAHATEYPFRGTLRTMRQRTPL